MRANGCTRSEEELYLAAYNGHEAVVRALIKVGMDVNKATGKGSTPLLFATQHDHKAVVQELIEEGVWISRVEILQKRQTLFCF